MTGVIEITAIEDDNVRGPLLVGVLKKGSLVVGMEAIVEQQLLQIIDIVRAEEVSEAFKDNEKLKIAVRGVSLDFLNSLIGINIKFSDLSHSGDKKILFKPTVA